MQIKSEEKQLEKAVIVDKKCNIKGTKISLYEYQRIKNSKIKNLIYNEKECNMIQQFIEFANDKTKYEWKSIESDINDFEMEYIDSNNNGKGICIARGTTIIDCNPEDLFFGYDDYTKIKELDENCLSVELKHKYDDHRRIVSGSFYAPSPFWNREFVFKEIRSIIDDKGNVINHNQETERNNNSDNHQIIDLQKQFINMKGRSSVCLGFSVEADQCPFEDIIRDKHVRCDLKFGGYYFKDIKDNQCRATYLVCMDLKGWIPAWFTNMILPQQSSNILKMKDYIDATLQKMKNTEVQVSIQ